MLLIYIIKVILAQATLSHCAPLPKIAYPAFFRLGSRAYVTGPHGYTENKTEKIVFARQLMSQAVA